MDDISGRFARYFEHRTPGATDARVVMLKRIPGGASRETYRLRVAWQADGAAHERGLILRRDPSTSLIDTDRRLEYRTYEAVHGTAVPVPEPLWLEEDGRWLDRPFSVMAEITGCEASPALLAEPPYVHVRERIAEQKFGILGRLVRIDPQTLELHDVMEYPDPRDCAARELAYWKGVIDEDELAPQPIVRAAIRRLERSGPPAASRLALVHGDYRSGNFLFDTDGNVRGVLDWEMAHIGDPLEDLAWALDPLWGWPDSQLAGRLVPRERAIALFEAASGIVVDRQAFRWWQIFASVKAAAIWISSCRDYADGDHRNPIIGVAGAITLDRQNRILVDRLDPASTGTWAEGVA